MTLDRRKVFDALWPAAQTWGEGCHFFDEQRGENGEMLFSFSYTDRPPIKIVVNDILPIRESSDE